MSTLAELEQELANAQEGLEALEEGVALGVTKSDEDVELIQTLKQDVADLRSRIAAKKPPPPPPSDDAPPPPPKYDMSKHPKVRKASPEAAVPPPPPEDDRLAFKAGDTVMARYREDRQWYPAIILTKTGAPTDPVYTVKFTGYGNKDNLRKHEVRAADKKRKAEAPSSVSNTSAAASFLPPPPASPNPVQNGTVISAAPSIDTTLVHKREPSKVSDGPTRMAPAPKKLKGNKTLQKAKDSWNDFQKAGPKKPGFGGVSKKPKDSQFRTPDLPNAKVGFTGSGKPMSKDPARKKWEYAQDQLDAD